MYSKLRVLAATLLLVPAAIPAAGLAEERPRAEVSQAALNGMQAMVRGPAFLKARAKLAVDYDRTIAELIKITETPAPPFKETARAKLFADMLRAHGLKEVAIDEEGNVIGIRPGTDRGAKFLVVSAHLDTVFPEGTPIKVRREGDRLFAPGIGDDSLGLASILAWTRAMDAAGIRTRQPILFMGTVGEEGQGDLRGVRHFFTKGQYKDRVAGFLSVDNSNVRRVVNGAVGSRRYRLTFKGPGGHSYSAFGTVNPMVALADTIRGLYQIDVPADPKTTFAASVIGGGTSVNSIPESGWVEVDMRSVDPASLAALEKRMLTVVQNSVAAENKARSTSDGVISVDAKLIGDRPAGATSPSHALVQAALAANRAHGLEPYLDRSSTDSNIPMSLGVPSLTVGSGSGGGRTHSLDEYLDVPREPFVEGLSVGLSLLLAGAGMR